MRKKAFAACFISVLLICASIGAWVVYHHARPGTSLLEFEYGDALQIDEKAEALPGMLSGGQQQRVAIARGMLRSLTPISSAPTPARCASASRIRPHLHF